ncbi:MAG TPA: hypothetical protein VJR06_06180 [Nitrososphaerales archaeon]|nr:hypothetical protein [Nitrososphaerales archaeon]
MQSLFLGDVTGFSALTFVGISAFMMAFRAKLLKPLGGADSLRNVHVIVSVLALAFLSLHIGILFNLPVTIPLDLGYGAFVLGIFLWATGVGFLERNKDSFLLHGSVAVAVVALILVHAAASGINFPNYVAVPALLAASSVAIVSGAYNVKKMWPKRG